MGSTFLVIGITFNSPPLLAQPLKACRKPPRQFPKRGGGGHGTPRLAREAEHNHLRDPTTESYTQIVRAVVAQPLPEAGCSRPSDGSTEKAATDYVGEVMRQLEKRTR